MITGRIFRIVIFLVLLFCGFSAEASTMIKSVPMSGLRAHWSFDSTSLNWSTGTVKDLTGNGYNGTTVFMDQPTNQVSGRLGQALFFDGDTDSVSLSTSPITDFSTANSACVWAKTNNVSTASGGWYQTILNVLADGNNGVRFGSVVNTGVLFASYRTGGTYYSAQTTSNVFSNNIWNHVCYVWNGLGVNLYANGNSISTTTNSDFIGLTNTIGARNDAGEGTWYGVIDDLRVYSRALSLAEIQSIYRSGALIIRNVSNSRNTIASTPSNLITSGLVGHWTMDGNRTNWTTGQITDSSGRGNTGQISGMATSTAPTMGKIGQAFSFDGVNDFINAGSAASLDNISQQGEGGMTISLWVKPTSASTFITKGGSSSGFWRLVTASGNKLQFEKGGSVTMVARTEANAYVDNTWNHVVVFSNHTSLGTASNVLFYVNGVLKSHDLDTNGFNLATDQNNDVTIGAYANASQASNAIFDDVRLYNRQLTTQEIRQLYLLGK